MTVNDKLPKKFVAWMDDCDKAGHALHVWARDVFASAVASGLHHILIEYPDTSQLTNASQEAGMRPYLVSLDARQILGFKYHISDDGSPTLDMVRILEAASVDTDEYSSDEVAQIRVLRPGSWELWRKVNEKSVAGSQWHRVKVGRNSLPFIPLLTVYTGRTGFMEASPPLLDLNNLAVAEGLIREHLHDEKAS